MSNLLRIGSNLLKFQSLKCVKSNRTRLFGNKTLEVNTNVVKDVILYKYDNAKYYKYLNIFAICQFGFWSYLSIFSYNTLRDAPIPKEEQSEVSWWRRFNLGENKFRYSIAFFTFMVGYGILTISWMYTLKSVRYLILRKGGQEITLVTYTPFGHNRMFTLNLRNVSAKQTREASTSQLPIKVKGHQFHYLLDMQGEFRNPALFDNTAGLKRKLNAT